MSRSADDSPPVPRAGRRARWAATARDQVLGHYAGLAAITRTWALEWATFGVRCVAIAPGMVETPMTRGMNQKARDALVASVPVGRIGEPEDLWLAVRFAIECDYFNARVIDVD